MENKQEQPTAETLIVLGFYDEALKLLDQVQDPDYMTLVRRAIALSKLNRLNEAIQSCENAILHDSSNYLAFYYRGLFNHMNGNFASSFIDLEGAASKLDKSKLLPNSQAELTRINTLKSKVQGEIAREKASKKAPEPSKQQEAPTPVQIPSSAPKPVTNPTSISMSAPQPVPVPAPDETKKLNMVTNASGKLLYSWHQNDNKVFVFIREKLQKKDDLKAKFDTKKVEITFPRSDNTTFELSLDLKEEIIPESATTDVKFEEIEIQLEKKIKRANWTSLEASGQGVLPQPVGAQPCYPSSSKVKKDWSKIDKDIEDEFKKNKEYDEDPANALFKEIYKNADENTRRAMIKSFQTSGGTVLSTNWDDVSNKDYEGKDRPEPSKGQEWKKWDK